MPRNNVFDGPLDWDGFLKEWATEKRCTDKSCIECATPAYLAICTTCHQPLYIAGSKHEPIIAIICITCKKSNSYSLATGKRN